MEDQSNNYFRASLKHHLGLKKIYNQGWLSSQTGISQQTISKILRGKSRGTHESQLKIANVFKLDYLSFLKMGESLLGVEPNPNNQDNFLHLINTFKDVKTAKKFVKILHRIEKDNTDTFYRLYNQSKFELSQLPKKNGFSLGEEPRRLAL